MAHGHKICGNGHDVAGPRTKVCPECGYVFNFKGKSVVIGEDGETVQVVKTRKIARLPNDYIVPEGVRVETIAAAAGEPPIKLNFSDETTDEDILDWACNTRQHMLNSGKYLTNAALGLWVAKFVPYERFNTLAAIRRVIKALPDVTYREVPVDDN